MIGGAVKGIVTYLTSNLLPSLGVVLTFGLIAAAIALYLFAGLAEEVYEGDTRHFDEWALAFVNRSATPALTSFMRAVTFLGSVTFLTGAGICAALAFAFARWKRSALVLFVTMVGATLLNFVLKMSFGRERPEPFFNTPLPESYSFPSGHALLSFCFYGIMVFVLAARLKSRGWRALLWTVGILLVGSIGLSRIYLGVHYPSDVLAGYTAAFVWLSVVAFVETLLQRRAVNVTHR
jgi:undecaprenyl-diphosphatase